jgi:hypothetical protein
VADGGQWYKHAVNSNREPTSMRLADIKAKLRRLPTNWSVAVLALGVLLTILWIGFLIFIVYYLL